VAGHARTRSLISLGLGLLVLAGAAWMPGPGAVTQAKTATAGQGPVQAIASKPASPASSNQLAPVDPCMLLTAAEVEAMVGELAAEPRSLEGPGGMFHQCSYRTASGPKLLLTVMSDEYWEGQKGIAEFKKGTEQVTGLGEEAFFMPDKDQGYTLRVLNRPAVLQINVTGGHDQALDLSKAVAAKVMLRL
jgi:hypothetical protein